MVGTCPLDAQLYYQPAKLWTFQMFEVQPKETSNDFKLLAEAWGAKERASELHLNPVWERRRPTASWVLT